MLFVKISRPRPDRLLAVNSLAALRRALGAGRRAPLDCARFRALLLREVPEFRLLTQASYLPEISGELTAGFVLSELNAAARGRGCLRELTALPPARFEAILDSLRSVRLEPFRGALGVSGPRAPAQPAAVPRPA